MKKLLSILLCVFTFCVIAQDENESRSMALSVNSSVPVVLGGGVTTIYDDTVDGDLGDRSAPTTIVLGAGTSRVIGNVGGVDFDDCMIFNVPAGNNVLSIVFSDYIVSGGNTSSGFNIYTGTPPDPAAFGDLISLALGASNVGQDILTDNGASPLTTGDYTLCFLEGTDNQVFAVDFGTDIVAAGPATPIPVNNIYWLLLLASTLIFVGYNTKRKINN